MILGAAGDDVVTDLQDAKLKLSQLKDRAAPALSAELVPYRGGFAGRYSSSIVVVSSEARAYALPAAAWSAFSGDTIAFVGRDGVPASTRKLLAQREKLRAREADDVRRRPALGRVATASSRSCARTGA